jgi:hypothetical protein
VTLEMTPAELGLLAVSRFSGMERNRIAAAFDPADPQPFTESEAAAFEAARLKWEGFERFLRLHDAEAQGRDINQILRSATRARFDFVFVDHLGMIGRDSDGHELALLNDAIHRLRGLSRGEHHQGYRPWVVATSQFNREKDKEDRIPRLSDFRGAARIEHDTDVVIGLQKRKRKEGDEGAWTQLDGFVLKNRNGPCPSVLLFDANGATGLVTERVAQTEAPPRSFHETDDEEAAA